METDIAVGKYAVAVVNKDRAVGHLMKEKTGKFAKIVFFFLRAEVSNMVTVKINRKAVIKRNCIFQCLCSYFPEFCIKVRNIVSIHSKGPKKCSENRRIRKIEVRKIQGKTRDLRK